MNERDEPRPSPEPEREMPPPAFETREHDEEDGLSRNGGDPREPPDDEEG